LLVITDGAENAQIISFVKWSRGKNNCITLCRTHCAQWRSKLKHRGFIRTPSSEITTTATIS